MTDTVTDLDTLTERLDRLGAAVPADYPSYPPTLYIHAHNSLAASQALIHWKLAQHELAGGYMLGETLDEHGQYEAVPDPSLAPNPAGSLAELALAVACLRYLDEHGGDWQKALPLFVVQGWIERAEAALTAKVAR